MDEVDLLRRTVAALDTAGIAHMVTGSVASALHGEPRATRDIDLVIDADLHAIELFVSSFPSDRFYVSDAAQAIRSRDMFNIVDTLSGWKVDLIVRKDRPFSESEFARREPARIAGVDTWVTTPEDAILSKLEWQHVSPSDTQHRDVVEMLIVGSDRLDVAYLEHWAAELGVTTLLTGARKQAAAARRQ